MLPTTCAAIDAIGAARPLDPLVERAELPDRSRNLGRAAGQGRDVRVEGGHESLQHVWRIAFVVDGHKQEPEGMNISPCALEQVRPCEQSRWADVDNAYSRTARQTAGPSGPPA